MFFPVLNRNHFFRAHFNSGFLKNFFFGIFLNRAPNIAPAAGKRQSSVVFLYKQNLCVFKNRRPSVNLRSLIAVFIAEKFRHFFKRKFSFVRNNFCGDFSDFFVTFNVELVFSVSESGLRYALKFYRPVKPNIFPAHFSSLFLTISASLITLLRYVMSLRFVKP